MLNGFRSFAGIRNVPYVTRGLQLHVDAGTKGSYPGSGTTWYNQAGLPNVTLEGTTFTTDAGGGISATQSSFAPFSSGLTFNGGFTISTWVRAAGNGSVQRLFTVSPEAAVLRLEGNNLRIYFFDTSNNLISVTVNNMITTTPTYYNFTATYDGSTLRLFRNNVEVGNLSSTNTLRTISDGYLLRLGTEGLVGNMYINQYYNRPLNTTEMTQNFNAFRGRFGL
jgi:hypothetical protein